MLCWLINWEDFEGTKVTPPPHSFSEHKEPYTNYFITREEALSVFILSLSVSRIELTTFSHIWLPYHLHTESLLPEMPLAFSATKNKLHGALCNTWHPSPPGTWFMYVIYQSYLSGVRCFVFGCLHAWGRNSSFTRTVSWRQSKTHVLSFLSG